MISSLLLDLNKISLISVYIWRLVEVSLYYVDDILLATNDLGLLHEMKIFLFKNLEMKDMGETFYVIGIEISCDKSQGLLGLS